MEHDPNVSQEHGGYPQESQNCVSHRPRARTAATAIMSPEFWPRSSSRNCSSASAVSLRLDIARMATLLHSQTHSSAAPQVASQMYQDTMADSNSNSKIVAR